MSTFTAEPAEPGIAESPSLNSRRSIMIALLVAGAFFMENLDGTVIATAIPEMARTFACDPVSLNIGMSGYLFALAIFIPASGWLADRFGARTIFSIAIAIFTLASVLCGMSNGVMEFTLARLLQGIGGAMMVPVGRIAVMRSTAQKDLLTAIAYITWPALVAPIIGPPVGGFITTYANWRWIFLLNVPLGIAGLILALKLIPNLRVEQQARFDIIGFIASALACSSLLYGLELLGGRDVHWTRAAIQLSISAISTVWMIYHMLHARKPLFDFAVMKIPSFRVTMLGGSLFRMSIGSVPFLLPLMFQVSFGMSAVTSGILILILFAGNCLMKAAVNPLLRRYGLKKVLIVNGLISAASLWALCFFTPQTPLWLISVILFAGGLTRSMQFTSVNTLGFTDIPKPLVSASSTLFSLAGQLNVGLGIALGAVTLRLAASMHEGQQHIEDFRMAFVVMGFIALAAVADCLTLPKNAGAAVTGHERRKGRCEDTETR